MKYNQLYAIPNLYVERSNPEILSTFEIVESDIAEALDLNGTIAVIVSQEDFGCIDYDNHGTTQGTDLYRRHRAEFPEFFENTYTERSRSGGLHVYFNKVDKPLLKTAWTSVDLLNQHNVWLKVAPTPGYSVLIDGPVLDLPEPLQAVRKMPLKRGNRDLAMPELVRPHEWELKRFMDRRLVTTDWALAGGRNQTLYQIAQNAFHSAHGSPEQRMGKALYFIKPFVEGVPSNKKKFRSVEDFWAFNRGLSISLSRAGGDVR